MVQETDTDEELQNDFQTFIQQGNEKYLTKDDTDYNETSEVEDDSTALMQRSRTKYRNGLPAVRLHKTTRIDTQRSV